MEIWYQDWYCGDNVKCGLLSKNATTWKTLKKTVSCSYHMEEKTFFDSSCINNINTGGKVAAATFEGL